MDERIGARADAKPGSAVAAIRSRWLLAAFAILLVLLATLLMLSRRPPRYRIGSVSQGPLSGMLHLPGRLEPTSTVKIGSPLSGRVASISVSIGEFVKRGQTLAKLEDAELRALASGAAAQSLAAEADVRQAQVRLVDLAQGRGDADDLPGEGASADLDMDDAALAIAETQLVRAWAMLGKQRALAGAARVVLGRATLRSPVDGLVLERSIEVGEMVSANTPGPPLFVVGSDPSRLQLVASISEVDVAQMGPRSVDFTTAAFPQKVFSGTVVAVWPATAQRQSTTSYQVILEIANDDLALWPGMNVLVKLPAQSAPNAKWVPAEALAFSPVGVPPLAGGRPSVWVLRRDTPERIPVSVGIIGDSLAEIRDPALASDTPIITGSNRR